MPARGKRAAAFCKQAGFNPVAHCVVDVGRGSAERLGCVLCGERFPCVAQRPKQDLELQRAGKFNLLVHQGARHGENAFHAPRLREKFMVTPRDEDKNIRI